MLSLYKNIAFMHQLQDMSSSMKMVGLHLWHYQQQPVAITLQALHLAGDCPSSCICWQDGYEQRKCYPAAEYVALEDKDQIGCHAMHGIPVHCTTAARHSTAHSMHR